MRKLLYAIFAFSLLFSSCEEDPAINVIIEGLVLNSETTQPIANAKIELITKSSTHTAISDETGYFNLGKYTIGDYTIIISKEGYSTQTQTVIASESLSAGNFGYDVVKSVISYLVPATEEAELTIYRKFEDGEVIAANNFPYVITTGDINSTIEGITDDFGRISLNNIPQVFDISIDYEVNGVRYKTTSTIDIHTKNYLIVYGYYAEASLGIASANILDTDGKPVQDFAIDGNVSIQFTMPVDTVVSKIDLLEGAWYSTDFTYQWSNNNMKLDINPINNLKAGTLYSIDLELTSVSGMQQYNNGINFITAN